MLTRWLDGCGGDCCVVYHSEFCRHWYQSVYERKYFGSDNGTPSLVNLNGGSFQQQGVFIEDPVQSAWGIQNKGCSSDLTDCDTSTDSKGFKYSADHWLNPTNNVASAYLSTLVIASKFQWWMKTFWNTCDSSGPASCWDSVAGAPVSNEKMLFLFDFVDKDNWTGLQIEYQPDFDVSPGAVQNIFEIKGRQNTAGTTADIAGPFTVDLGLASNRIEVDMEINVDQRTECGTDPFVVLKFGGEEVNFSFTSKNGDYIAVAQSTPGNVVETVTCGGTDYDYADSFGIYNWVIRYLESEETGCASYTLDCCDCFTPEEIDVTFSGFTECAACLDLNDTFTLVHEQGAGLGCTHWGYDFDEYSIPKCTVNLYGRDCELNIKRLTIDLLNNKFTLRMICQIFIQSQVGSGNACDYFIWEHTEGANTPPPCYLESGDTWTYVDNDATSARCPDTIGATTVYFNIDDFCDSYTLTVANG